MNELQPRPRLAHFIHIPKTGGHTLEAIFEGQYGPEALFYSRWGREYEGPRGRPIGVFLKSVEAGIPGHIHFPELLEDVAARLDALSVEARGTIRLIHGKNLEFGLAAMVPESLASFTFLRDPVDRVLSQYFFTVGYPSKPDQISLFDHIAAHIQPNLQTLMLSGPHGLNPQPEADVMLARAKENLRVCAVVGITEYFGESVLFLTKSLGWSPVSYARHKVNRTRPHKAEIPEEVLRRMAAANALDMELYEFARSLFREQAESYGPELAADMEELGRRNILFRSQIHRRRG